MADGLVGEDVQEVGRYLVGGERRGDAHYLEGSLLREGYVRGTCVVGEEASFAVDERGGSVPAYVRVEEVVFHEDGKQEIGVDHFVVAGGICR